MTRSRVARTEQGSPLQKLALNTGKRISRNKNVFCILMKPCLIQSHRQFDIELYYLFHKLEYFNASSVTSDAADEATSVGTSKEVLVAGKAGLVTAARVGFSPVNVDAWNAVVSPAGELIVVEDLDGVVLSAGSGPGVEQAGCESDAGGGVDEAVPVADRVLDSGDKS
ncbi:hypothetical protein J6590_083433 [Homalodisca vitripennis]|nr:hypothetical protein J6590_083433 [Homalodisca vitripennis]